MFVPGGNGCESIQMQLAVGIYEHEYFQAFPAGTDKQSQGVLLLTEKAGQCRRVGHMVEVEPHGMAVSFQLVGTVSGTEYPRGSKAGQLCFELTGSFPVSGSQGIAVRGYLMHPMADTDQDNDFFEGTGF